MLLESDRRLRRSEVDPTGGDSQIQNKLSNGTIKQWNTALSHLIDSLHRKTMFTMYASPSICSIVSYGRVFNCKFLGEGLELG
jgi:hypothetical protein